VGFDLTALRQAATNYKANGLAIYEQEIPGFGGMSPGQRAFHESKDVRRLCVAGNQVGKTRMLSAETWWLALGRHPFREVIAAPNIGWIMTADLKGGWSNFCAKMREIEPPGAVSERCFYDPVRGYTRGGSKVVELNNGSIIVGKSGSQEMIALAGASIDWGVIDELPKQGHFSEFRSRCAVRGSKATVVMSFTPIGRPALWLRDWVEGDEQGNAPRELWDIHKIELSVENCPHRDPQSIEDQINSYGPFEYDQRVKGAWQGVSNDRWIAGFGDDNLFSEPPKNIESLGLGFDHGERPGASVCYLVGYDGSTAWVLAEYQNEERNTPLMEAKAITEMIGAWGIKLTQIEHAFGDSNSSGRLGLGFSVNSLLERAFADIMKQARPPFDIRVPYKGPGSIKARARMMNTAAIEGRLRVHESCTSLINTLRYWRGGNDDLKHSFDSCGYICDTYLGNSFDNIGHMLIS
jgi:hypothetical protein